MKLDFSNLCQKHNITPRGIISIGASDGKTLKRFSLPDTVKTILIDANPNAVERLQTYFVDSSNIQVVQAAISNRNDTVTLHLTSLESSSSILPWKQYKEIYPNIKTTQQLTLPSRSLDTLFEELDLSPSDFNILILDIQGAELLALEGTPKLLNTLDVIYTIIYYQELFEGVGLAEQIDQFLGDYEFQRVATASPYHPAWGEAFYVRQAVSTKNKVHLVKEDLSQTTQRLQETQQHLEILQAEYQEIVRELQSTRVELQQNVETLAELKFQQEQILAELEPTQTKLQESQTALQQSQAQLEQTQKEFDHSRSELHEVREELELTQFQLDEVQVELEQYVTQFHQQKAEITKLQTELEQTKMLLTQIKPQSELTVAKKSKSDNAALVKLLAKVLAETIED